MILVHGWSSCRTDTASHQAAVNNSGVKLQDFSGKATEDVLVTVFCAGSLNRAFEMITAAVEAEHPDVTVVIEPGGSVDRIRRVTGSGRPADVLASADSALIPEMMMPEHADWYLTFAKNRMVLTCTSESRYADEITAADRYAVLGRDGVRSGRLLWPELKTPAVTALFIRPKVDDLVWMVRSGDLDYAGEYRSVAVQNSLRSIEVPEEIDLSSVDFAENYATVRIEVKMGDAPNALCGFVYRLWFDRPRGRRGPTLTQASRS